MFMLCVSLCIIKFKKMKTTKGTFCRSLIDNCKATISILCILILILAQSCITIQPGEVGLKVKRGTLAEGYYVPGRYPNGSRTQYVVFSTRVKEMTLNTNLPTKESLEAKVNLTMLYHI